MILFVEFVIFNFDIKEGSVSNSKAKLILRVYHLSLSQKHSKQEYLTAAGLTLNTT